MGIITWRRTLAAACAVATALLLAACGGGNSAPRQAGADPAPGATATAPASATDATLAGATLRVVRTLQPGALSAAKLEPAGEATAPDGTRIAMARGAAPALAPWELASGGPDGWRIWWPEPVLQALSQAGADARVVAVTPVDWPDACLGVRAPGKVCAQVVTPGYRIIIDAGGKRVEYHTDRASPPHVVVSR
ncbi:MAG: hypothetical protein ACYDEB_11130 [Dehalococcoidia bacterium]